MNRNYIATVLAPTVLALALNASIVLADEKARLSGAEEVPSVSTTGAGDFRIRIRGDTAHYELSYSNLEGTVTQVHIHFGQRGVNGSVSVFLCDTAISLDPTGLAPECPSSPGDVEGTLTAANVIGPAGQGIEPGQFDELVEVIKDGLTYVNVHTDKFPAGEIRGQIR